MLDAEVGGGAESPTDAHMHGRRLFTQGALAVAASALLPRPKRAFALDPGKVRPALTSSAFGDGVGIANNFHRWMVSQGFAQDRLVRNLVFNFYDTDKNKGSWVYPMLCGKAIIWLLGRKRVADAIAVADALLRWQQIYKHDSWEKSYGSFPSAIDRDPKGVWKAGDRYYAGDNLVILDAFLQLYERAKSKEVLNAAVGIGTWLCNIMCAGLKLQTWKEDHGAPMWFVNAKGDFSNNIYANVEMLWISALYRLGKITSECAYCRQAEKAFRFYKLSQTPKGAFYDHYDPAYPPLPYSASRWITYAGRQVISDNVLRAALGLCRWGELELARKTFDWLKVQNGGIPAYLDIQTGQHGFDKDSDVYFDVTSSGMYRSLCQWLGKKVQGKEAVVFLRRTQDKNGGWYWGVFKNGLKPVRPEMCPMPGFWATADLSAVDG